MGDSMREALEDAWDNDETEVAEDGSNQQELGVQPDESAEDTSETIEHTDDVKADAGTGDDDQAVPGVEEVAEPVAPEDPAPVSLPPAAREAWKNTPKEMREAIATRERQYAQGIQKHAENAKRAESMDRALEPFQGYFASTGLPPVQALGNLLQARHPVHLLHPWPHHRDLPRRVPDGGRRRLRDRLARLRPRVQSRAR